MIMVCCFIISDLLICFIKLGFGGIDKDSSSDTYFVVRPSGVFSGPSLGI